MLRVFATGSLLKISEKLNEVVATARNMCNALTHCLDLLSQQEEVSWIWKNFISWIIDFLSHEALRKLYFHWPLNTHLVRNEISFIFIFLLFFPFSKTSLLTPSVSVSIAFVTKSLSILLGIFVLRIYTFRRETERESKRNPRDTCFCYYYKYLGWRPVHYTEACFAQTMRRFCKKVFQFANSVPRLFLRCEILDLKRRWRSGEFLKMHYMCLPQSTTP